MMKILFVNRHFVQTSYQFWLAGQCGTSNLLVTNDAQILAYPSDGFNYPNNQVCSWTLVSSNTFDLVEISFLSFDTELLHDTLTVSCHFARVDLLS